MFVRTPYKAAILKNKTRVEKHAPLSFIVWCQRHSSLWCGHAFSLPLSSLIYITGSAFLSSSLSVFIQFRKPSPRNVTSLFPLRDFRLLLPFTHSTFRWKVRPDNVSLNCLISFNICVTIVSITSNFNRIPLISFLYYFRSSYLLSSSYCLFNISLFILLSPGIRLYTWFHFRRLSPSIVIMEANISSSFKYDVVKCVVFNRLAYFYINKIINK